MHLMIMPVQVAGWPSLSEPGFEDEPHVQDCMRSLHLPGQMMHPKQMLQLVKGGSATKSLQTHARNCESACGAHHKQHALLALASGHGPCTGMPYHKGQALYDPQDLTPCCRVDGTMTNV